MTGIVFKCGDLDFSEMQGETEAEILVGVDAELQVLQDARLLYSESSFPVVELARDLSLWILEENPDDFSFESMSFEEIGVVTLSGTTAGWLFKSVFSPLLVADPVQWSELSESIRALVSKVREDLIAQGLDPHKIFQEPTGRPG